MSMAQAQLMDGTASSQTLSHFLKLGSIRHQVELEKIRRDTLLVEEKILAERNGQQSNEMMAEVLAAIKEYKILPPGEAPYEY